MSTLDQYPQRDGIYRVLREGVAVQNRYQERVVMLDPLSSEIWLRADGKTSLREIARDMAGTSAVPVSTMCRIASMLVIVMNTEGVLYSKNEAAPLPYHLQYPQEDQDVERMHDSLLASGWLDD